MPDELFLGRDGVTIINENMVINEEDARALSQFPRGSRLLDFHIIEQGHDLGRVANLLLGISPPIALRVVAFELEDRRTRIAAHEIASSEDDKLYKME